MTEIAKRILEAIDAFKDKPKLIRINEDIFWNLTNDANTSFLDLGTTMEVRLYGIPIEFTEAINGWEIT